MYVNNPLKNSSLPLKPILPPNCWAAFPLLWDHFYPQNFGQHFPPINKHRVEQKIGKASAKKPASATKNRHQHWDTGISIGILASALRLASANKPASALGYWHRYQQPGVRSVPSPIGWGLGFMKWHQHWDTGIGINKPASVG